MIVEACYFIVNSVKMKIWSLESLNQLKKKPLFPVQVVRLVAGQAVAEGRVRYLLAEGRVRLHSVSK
jgi:hypothetical protein